MANTYYIFDFYTRKQLFRRTTGLLVLSDNAVSFRTFKENSVIGTPETTTFKLNENTLVFNNKQTGKQNIFLRTGGTIYRLPQEKNNALMALLTPGHEASYNTTVELIGTAFGEYKKAMFMDGKYTAEIFAFLLKESGFEQQGS